MGNTSNSIQIPTKIRQAIFEKFNDVETMFTNDQILDILKNNNDVENSCTIDYLENYFKEICDDGLVRCIAQDFTTQWYKLFDNIEKLQCSSCNQELYLGKSEQRICLNPECKKPI